MSKQYEYLEEDNRKERLEFLKNGIREQSMGAHIGKMTGTPYYEKAPNEQIVTWNGEGRQPIAARYDKESGRLQPEYSDGVEDSHDYTKRVIDKKRGDLQEYGSYLGEEEDVDSDGDLEDEMFDDEDTHTAGTHHVSAEPQPDPIYHNSSSVEEMDLNEDESEMLDRVMKEIEELEEEGDDYDVLDEDEEPIEESFGIDDRLSSYFLNEEDDEYEDEYEEEDVLQSDDEDDEEDVPELDDEDEYEGEEEEGISEALAPYLEEDDDEDELFEDSHLFEDDDEDEYL